MTSQKYEPTTEDLERWEKLDELGMTAAVWYTYVR
jgi:hypothetical protein